MRQAYWRFALRTQAIQCSRDVLAPKMLLHFDREVLKAEEIRYGQVTEPCDIVGLVGQKKSGAASLTTTSSGKMSARKSSPGE
jgi:hypothetical protein